MHIGRKTLMLDFCWVCNERFKTSKPPGPANREDHHIFPRNAGGTDGPLVSLCDSDHTNLHLIARRLHAKKPFADVLIGKNKAQAQRLVWLGSKAYEAEKLFQGDDNKQATILFKPSREEIEMLRRLQPILGVTGRLGVISAAIRSLYKIKNGNGRTHHEPTR